MPEIQPADATRARFLQIEKFIEGIYPSQTARTLQTGQVAKPGRPGVSPEEEERKRKEEAEARTDVMWLAIAVFGTLIVITLLMVRTYLLPLPHHV